MSAGQRPIVAVIYAEATAPVVLTQSVPLLRAMRAAGREVGAAIFASPRRLVLPGARSAHDRAFAAFADATGSKPLVFTHRPRQSSFRGSGRRLARALRRAGFGDAALLCRQPRAALVGSAARNRLRRAGPSCAVLDLRGIRDAEYLLSVGKEETELAPDERARLAAYRRREGEACDESDAVLCVSRPMVRLVRDRHGVEPQHIGRVPNHAAPVEGAEELRSAARRRLRVADDELVIAYQGTIAAWQMAEESALLMRAVAATRAGVRALFVTPNKSAARAAIRRTALTDPIIESAKPGEVHHILAAADYGLLLRHDHLVNRVACPVKFGEYLACGVRPVLTPFIGDQSDMCATTGMGVVVRPEDAGEAARRLAADAERSDALGPAARAVRRAWARENIAPERTALRVLEFLDGLAPEAR